MASKKVILPISAAVRTEAGIRSVDRGQPLPSDVLPEEKKRLEDQGVLGTPAQAAAFPSPIPSTETERQTPVEAAQAALDAAEVARLQETANEDVRQKQAELIAEQQGATAPAAPAAPTAPALDAENEAFDAYIKDASADDVVAAVEAQPEDDRAEYAAAIVEAEKAGRGDKARKTVLALVDDDSGD